jgi:hypothetical protein
LQRIGILVAELGGPLHERPAAAPHLWHEAGVVLPSETAVPANDPDAATVTDPHPVSGGVDGPDHVELVGHDAHVGQRLLDRLSVGPVTVDDDGFDRGPDLVGHRHQASEDGALPASLD